MIFPTGWAFIALWLLLSLQSSWGHSLAGESGMVDYNYVDYYGLSDEPEEYLYYEDDVDGTACPRFCSCFVSKVVDCSRRNFQNISSAESNEATTFSGILPEDTTTVHFGYNNLTTLPPMLFWSGRYTGNLEYLYLQSNEIHFVHPDAFAALPNLTDLDLSNNRISNFRQSCEIMQDHFFAFSSVPTTTSLSCATSGMDVTFLRSASPNLSSLNLNSNKLKGIPRFSFSSLKQLEVLKLNWNKITWISPRAFVGLAKLKVLQLRSNHLNAITLSRLGPTLGFIEVYKPWSGLQTDDSNHPHHSMLRLHQTNHEISPDRLHLHTNTLTKLDLGDTDIATIPDIASSSLKRLYLDLNRITTITQEAFQSLTNLEVLHLGGNNITHIAGGTFASLESLKVLDLSRNNLHVITHYAFKGLLYLHSLRLHQNPHLSEIHPDAFERMWSLRLLYLQNCNLTTLHTNCWIHTIKCLWLYGNPIDCNCDTSYDLMAIFQRRRANSKPLLDPFRSASIANDMDTWPFLSQQRTTCAAPKGMVGLPILQTTPENLNCRNEGMSNMHISMGDDDELQSLQLQSSLLQLFRARILCERLAHRKRRFSQDDPLPSPSPYVESLPPSLAKSNDFESILGDFTNHDENTNHQFVGGDSNFTDDGSIVVSSADEMENSTNLQPEDDDMLSMLYGDLLYSEE